MKNLFPIIGLEVHVELSTISKMFCQCLANYFELKPNTNICPVCLGMPGALPVPNKKAILFAQIIGKSLNCKLNKESKFDRKHYFYPDLAKGYQISQYDEPLCINGMVEINNKKFRIRRVHLEEDTGKLIHKGPNSLIDFNRSGVPLVEIVTEPDFNSSLEVKSFLTYLHTLIQQYLKVSDANMEKGTMRLEPNISLSENINKIPNYRIEIKNINSFRYVKNAIDYELKRQTELLLKGVNLQFETRGYDEKQNITFSQRIKEEAKDYRYFPEPDIPIMIFDKKYLDSVITPTLPFEKKQILINKYNLNDKNSDYLISNLKKLELFEKVSEKIKEIFFNQKQVFNNEHYQKIANYIINKTINTDISLKELIELVQNQLLPEKSSLDLVKKTVNNVLLNNKSAVLDYKKGNKNTFKFLIGQVIKELKTKSDIKEVIKILLEKLNQ